MLIVARRGLTAQAPENTIAAYLKCVDAGVDWFQGDVRALADNALIMVHDQDASRTTNGRGLFAQMEFANLRRLDAGSWFAPKYRLERVPELTSVIELLNNTDLHADLELHFESGADRDRQTFVETVAQVVQAVNSVERLLISSRHGDLLTRLASLDPRLALGLVGDSENQWDSLRLAADIGCKTVIVQQSAVTRQLILDADELGLTVWADNVEGAERALELDGWGAGAVISDHAEKLVKALPR